MCSTETLFNGEFNITTKTRLWKQAVGRGLVRFAVKDELDGQELWNHPWPGGHPKVNVPVVVSSNQLVTSSGYGVGANWWR